MPANICSNQGTMPPAPFPDKYENTLPDKDILKRYAQIKFLLADQLRIASEDAFALAVPGQFKRGKSSSMNAIIGRKLLPMSAITKLKHEPEERLLITKEGVPFTQEFPVLEEDSGDMRNYALKFNIFQHRLTNIREENACERTIIRIVATRRFCAPWQQD